MNSIQKMLVALVLVNLAGFAYGIFFYWQQLNEINPLLWIFVIDSPLYVFLIAIVFSLALFRIKNDLLNFVAGAGALKIGLWSMFAILFYNEFFLAPQNVAWYSVLFALHAGMVLEGLFLAGGRASKKIVFSALAWFLASDFFDYVIGTYPSALPQNAGKLLITSIFTLALSLFSIAVFYYASKKKTNLFAWSRELGELRKQVVS